MKEKYWYNNPKYQRWASPDHKHLLEQPDLEELLSGGVRKVSQS